LESTFTIRDITEADYDEWAALWAQYNAFYGRVGLTALPQHIIQSTWARLLDESEPVYGLVAEHDGRLVGLAHYIFHRNTITIENTAYLQDLFSDPEKREQGIGRGLISAFYERAQQVGTVGVYWHTQGTNKAAMRLYDKVATNTEFVVYRHKVGRKPT